MADTIQHTAADQADGQTTLVEYEATAHHTIVWDDSGGHTHSGTGSTGKPITGIGAATMSGDIAGGENNISNITLYGIHNIGTGDYDVQLKSNQTLTSNRILFLNVGDASRTLTIGGNVNFGNAWTTSGAYGTTITITGTTNITFPTSGTLASLAGTETLTNKTLGATSFSGNVSLGDNTITDVAGIDFEVGSGDGFISTSTTANEALIVQCRDVDGSAWVQAINLKPHNSPTFTLGSTGFATQTIAGTWATSSFSLGATTFSGTVNVQTLDNLNYIYSGTTTRLAVWSNHANDYLAFRSSRTAANAGSAFVFESFNGADSLTHRLHITGGVNTAVMTMSNMNFIPSSNNTLTIGVDTGDRFAGGYFVDLKGKTVTTGKILEEEIPPKLGETFDDGDVVCLDNESITFTKCTQIGDEFILGVVYAKPITGISGTQEVTKWHMVNEVISNITIFKNRQVPVTHTVWVEKNLTLADGTIIQTKTEETRTNVTVVQVEREVTLLDGSVMTALVNETQIMTMTEKYTEYNVVYGMVNRSYTVTEDVWGTIGTENILVFAGVSQVKVCQPVSRGDILIAGNSGCAVSADSLFGSKSVDGITVPNKLMARDRTFGIAAEDSSDGMVTALIRY